MFVSIVLIYEDLIGKIPQSKKATLLQESIMRPSTLNEFWKYWGHNIATLEITAEALSMSSILKRSHFRSPWGLRSYVSLLRIGYQVGWQGSIGFSLPRWVRHYHFALSPVCCIPPGSDCCKAATASPLYGGSQVGLILAQGTVPRVFHRCSLLREEEAFCGIRLDNEGRRPSPAETSRLFHGQLQRQATMENSRIHPKNQPRNYSRKKKRWTVFEVSFQVQKTGEGE